jgi:hypothetical protein
MTERGDDDQNHGPNLTETRGVRSVSNSFILRLHGVLTRDNHTLIGPASLDWGVCGNPRSHRAGLLTFEHQGCGEFEPE